MHSSTLLLLALSIGCARSCLLQGIGAVVAHCGAPQSAAGGPRAGAGGMAVLAAMASALLQGLSR